MLRGLAALIVALAHVCNQTHWLGGILGKGAGQLGVMIFFMLSGFLMSFLYIGKEINLFNIKKYCIARLARVVPLFLLVLFCSYGLQQFGYKNILYFIETREVLIAHLLLFKGENVLWTIPTELQFYAIFILLWWLHCKREAYLYIFLVIIVATLIFTGFPRLSGIALGLPYDIQPLQGLPYFIVGVIFGKNYSTWKAPDFLVNDFFILALLFIPLMYPEIFLAITGHKHVMWKSMSTLAAMSMIFYAIVFMVPDDNILLNNRIGDFLGRISYSFYLLHLPILWQVKQIENLDLELKLLVFAIIALSISYISYRFLELPSSRYLREFYAAIPAQARALTQAQEQNP